MIFTMCCRCGRTLTIERADPRINVMHDGAECPAFQQLVLAIEAEFGVGERSEVPATKRE